MFIVALILILACGLLIIDQWAFPVLVVGFFILLVMQCSQSVSDAQSEIDALNRSNVAAWQTWR